MAKDFQQLFSYLEEKTPEQELLSKVLVSIKKQEIRRKNQKMVSFLLLSLATAFTIPFTSQMLINQINNSGIAYFLGAIVNDFHSFLSFWQTFSLAILESLPITGLLIFAVSLEAFAFTFRLFLREKNFKNRLRRQGFAFKI
ncbi:MAG: hypothetical protein WC306_00605 [Candidatus Paceibacterota bacterium]